MGRNNTVIGKHWPKWWDGFFMGFMCNKSWLVTGIVKIKKIFPLMALKKTHFKYRYLYIETWNTNFCEFGTEVLTRTLQKLYSQKMYVWPYSCLLLSELSDWKMLTLKDPGGFRDILKQSAGKMRSVLYDCSGDELHPSYSPTAEPQVSSHKDSCPAYSH